MDCLPRIVYVDGCHVGIRAAGPEACSDIDKAEELLAAMPVEEGEDCRRVAEKAEMLLRENALRVLVDAAWRTRRRSRRAPTGL